jgi:hypothetical protein
VAGLGHNPGLQERLHQRHNTVVLNPGPDPIHQEGVIDHVETRLDGGVQHPVVALGTEPVDVGHGVMRPPLGSETVGTGKKSASKIGSNTSFSAAWTIGSNTSFSAAWTTRSAIGGMPSLRSFPDPPGFGIIR